MRRISFIARVRILVLSGACLAASLPAHADEPVAIDQGWSLKDKAAWYTLSQGSRLIPLAWLQALEQPGVSQPNSPQLFLDRAHIEKFRYLPHDSAGAGRLPIGFTIDTQSDAKFSEVTRLRWKKPQSDRESWVGFNCAACHTNEMTYQGKRLRIEGAPTLADFQAFMKALNRALIETRDDPDKWKRFAAAVLAGVNTPANRTLLKGELGKLIDWETKVETANDTPLAYGFARLDAFGHIFNKVLLRVDATGQPRNPSDAPVSYPFLWNIHQQDKVQWNGIAPNVRVNASFDIGALGRNAGEVIGVFADLKLQRFGPSISGYTSSTRVRNLVSLEKQLTRLKPPAWPDVFPAIDADKWEAGKALFERSPGGCAACHMTLKRDDLTTPVDVTMTRLIGKDAIDTDPWMACNAYTYEARTGLLQGTPKKFFVFSSLPFGETGSVAEMLGATVTGVLWNNKDTVIDIVKTGPPLNFFDPKIGPVLIDPDKIAEELFRPIHDSSKAARLKRCLSEGSPILAYKGRPLTGIWATAPYLHNGSVPTLYDLLLAPKDRPASFAVGTREFDPEKVGYVTNESKFVTEKTTADNAFLFQTRDSDGMIPGNANTGHDYGNAALADNERWALVEYLKAVGGRRVGNKIVP